MEKRVLGRTGLDVSLLTFGCGAVGGLMTKGDPADQRKAAETALSAGVNFFDTAALYGDGASETNVGRLLRELQPDIILGTKVNVPPGPASNVGDEIRRSIGESLSRLGRDHVDLLQLHNRIADDGDPRSLSPDVVLNDVRGAFEQLQRDGKIRYFGITAIGETPALHRVISSGAFHTAQIVFNLLNPSAGRAVPEGFPGQDYAGLLETAHAAGVGTIAIRTVAGGALSGSEARHPLGMPDVAPIGSGADYREDVERARQFATVAGANGLIELSIRAVAGNPLVSTMQVGMATVGELENAIACVNKGRLPDAVLTEIMRIQDGFATGN